MPASSIPTKPFTDQKPGTSGLRKKVVIFQQANYTANFIQSTFDAIRALGDAIPDTIVVGGDGRYYVREAVQIILRVAAANGVRRAWVGHRGLLSTPAVSALIRRRVGADGVSRATGAFILTASHNPGGPTEDFGIKYNTANGGPAPEKLTDAIYQATLRVDTLHLVQDLPEVNLDVLGTTQHEGFTVEVIDSVEDYTTYMKEVFNFASIKALLARPDFRVHIDCLHGASGPYVTRLFGKELGVPAACLHNADVLPDFGGSHPDPNLTYAHDLVAVMGLRPDGSVNAAMDGETHVPQFGAAFDGDADRNMILGDRFFVNPSDSLAVLAANAHVVPFFQKAGGIKAVARSMPTSGAVDRVATVNQLKLFEVPTGWKFFGNLMDSKEVFGGEDYTPLICGEESFGTGSNHIREKDGVWAALFWLSVVAARNAEAGPTGQLQSMQCIVEDHWRKYGRNYYSRYDYEGVTTESAEKVMATVLHTKPDDVPHLRGTVPCKTVDSFEYHDPVDHSVSKNQGARVLFSDGSRFVVRLSGTGSSGATIRLYLEQFMAAEEVRQHLDAKTLPLASDALKDLIAVALRVAKIPEFTGRDAPTVIT